MPLRGAAVSPFLTAEIARGCAARRAAGLPVIAMHFGQPNEGPPLRALEAVRASLDVPDPGYWESPALRERIRQHYSDRYGVNVSTQRILLTIGASAALTGLFAAAFAPGDRVAIVCPGYPAYRAALRAMRLEPLELRVRLDEGYHLTAARLAALEPAPQGLLLASPANPTGAVTGGRALAEIAAVCRDRGIRLLSDEIYHGLSFGGDEHTALEFDDDAFVIGSFSKYHRMPGWRLGWLVAPDAAAGPVQHTLLNLFLTPPVPAQRAALAALDADPELTASIERYARNRGRLVEGLKALGIDARLPEGAFYLYADFGRYTHDSLGFCRRAVEEIGLGLAPGVDFDPLEGNRFVRLCFAVSESDVEAALAVLAAWLPNYRDR